MLDDIAHNAQKDTPSSTKVNLESLSLRLVIPQFLINKLKQHPLTRSLYPSTIGHHKNKFDLVVKKQQLCHYLLIYCYDGVGELMIEGSSHNITAGDIVLLPPRLSHSLKSTGKEFCSFYWVEFTGELSNDFYERLFMKMPSHKTWVGIFPSVTQDLEQLIQLSGKGYTATNVIYAVHVLQHCLSFLALQLRLNPQKGQQLNLVAIENFMLENLNRDITLEELAEYCQLSKFHFSKKFKSLTDNSPVQHFINLKMERACQLLDSTSEPIKKIAAQLGYSDPYYFSRLYKKVIGLSPAQYRKNKHH